MYHISSGSSYLSLRTLPLLIVILFFSSPSSAAVIEGRVVDLPSTSRSHARVFLDHGMSAPPRVPRASTAFLLNFLNYDMALQAKHLYF